MWKGLCRSYKLVCRPMVLGRITCVVRRDRGPRGRPLIRDPRVSTVTELVWRTRLKEGRRQTKRVKGRTTEDPSGGSIWWTWTSEQNLRLNPSSDLTLLWEIQTGYPNGLLLLLPGLHLGRSSYTGLVVLDPPLHNPNSWSGLFTCRNSVLVVSEGVPPPYLHLKLPIFYKGLHHPSSLRTFHFLS